MGIKMTNNLLFAQVLLALLMLPEKAEKAGKEGTKKGGKSCDKNDGSAG